MAVICPTITAFDDLEYNEQIRRLKPFAKRIHIDLMDGEFAPTISPRLEHIWWPPQFKADIHLMYKWPMHALPDLILLKPDMVIIHAETKVDHRHFAARLHQHDIETGLAIMPETTIADIEPIMHSFNQILIFSGNLGHQGGTADLTLLDKVREIKHLHPDVEIAWDGGITSLNAPALKKAGVDVLNVGSFIHKSEDPALAFKDLSG